MELLEGLNAAIKRVEETLREPDLPGAARLAGLSEDGFARFFSYMTGMSLGEYVRKRRLTRAGEMLARGNPGVLEVAVELGYESGDAFRRAFVRQHGVTPSCYRKHGGSLQAVPPVSFHIIVKGARAMDLRFLELEETEVFGMSEAFSGGGSAEMEAVRNRMWDEKMEDIPGQITGGSWNAPGSHVMDGAWYGLWQEGRYLLGRDRAQVQNPERLERWTIPAGKYAAVRSQPGGLAWEELPRLREELLVSWLPSSGYKQAAGPVVEVEHLWTQKEERAAKRYYEVWLRITEK